MLSLLRKRKMVGGLYFGPAGWAPERIETTFSQADSAPAQVSAEAPADAASLADWLSDMGLGTASVHLPGVADQVRGLNGRRPRALVLNLLAAQPEYLLGATLSRLAMADMAAGVKLLGHAIRPERTVVVIDRHDRQTRKLWKRPVIGNAAIIPLLNRYPQAQPSVLLRTLCGARLPVGALPSAAGYVMVDPVSAWAIGRRLRTGRGFVDRPVQYFERSLPGGEPRLLMGQIGETLLEFCSRHRLPSPMGTAESALQVIVNGMLAGESVDPAAARITGTTESIAVRQRPDSELASPCISCGWCVDVCPSGLAPVHLLELSHRAAGENAAPGGVRTEGEPGFPCPSFVPKRLAMREARHCIACGLCSYVCPTRLPLTREIVKLRIRVAPRLREGSGT